MTKEELEFELMMQTKEKIEKYFSTSEQIKTSNKNDCTRKEKEDHDTCNKRN